MPDNTLSRLEDIRIKVRRATRNPSSAQLLDADIDKYVNSFILYDMPAYLKLNSLKQVLTFFTEPNKDTYSTADIADFKNKYTNIDYPIFVGGNPVELYQKQDEFYLNYPKTNFKLSMGTGDGGTVAFTSTTDSYPILPNQVTVSSVNTAGDPLLAYDDGDYGFTGDVIALSTVDYVTGQVYVSFTSAPAVGQEIWLQTVPYTASKPTSVLYFQDKLIFRPVPDIAYRVEVSVNVRPTELINSADMPELSEWWQYIALGASIKLLEDRLDMEAVNMLMPQFKNQEVLINRRKIVQNSMKSSPTMFADQGDYSNKVY